MSYLDFIEIQPGTLRKTQIFKIRNIKLNEDIGTIEWDCGWRKYVYITPDYSMRYCQFCMFEIARFVENLNNGYLYLKNKK